MSDDNEKTTPDSPEPSSPAENREADAGSEDSADVSALVKRSMGGIDSREVDVLSGVQRKLRQRSHGKFYRDGWSTVKQPPVTTYLITSLLMLAITLAIYSALSSLSGTAAEVREAPKPVRIVPPRDDAPHQRK